MSARSVGLSYYIFLAAMCVIGRLIVDDEPQTGNYLKAVIRSNSIVALLLMVVSFFANGWPAFGLLLTVFLLLAVPIAVGIVTWLKHEN
jgi:hypothetical protein